MSFKAKPTPLAIAEILESTLLSEQPYGESLPVLRAMLRDNPRTRDLLDLLDQPQENAPTLMELAKLLLTFSEHPFGCYETALGVVQRSEEGRQAYEELMQLGEDAGDVVDKDRWPVMIVQRHRDVDVLLAADEWDDPANVVDPGRENVDCETYRKWLSICAARLKRGEGEPTCLRTTIKKIQAAAQWDLRQAQKGYFQQSERGYFDTVNTIGSDSESPRCSFCRKAELDVQRLIPGSEPDIYICDECIGTCTDVVADHEKLREKVAACIRKGLLLGSPKDVAPAVRKRFPQDGRLVARHLRQWAERPGLAPSGLDFSSKRASANLIALAKLLEEGCQNNG
jgi:hypothetical protein